MHDTVLAIDSQTGQIQWQYADANEPEPQVARKVWEILASPKYWLLLIQHVETGPVQYEVIVDRQSGRVIYDSGAMLGFPIHAMAISDEALFDHYDGQFLRRVDLPTGITRWYVPLEIRHPNGVLAIDKSLYVFESGIQQFDPMDGHLVASVALSVTLPTDVLAHGSLAIVRNARLEEQGIEVLDLKQMSPVWDGYVDSRSGRGLRGDLPVLTVTPDSIYLFDAQDTLWRLDVHTGKVLWQTSAAGSEALSRPAVTNGTAYGFFADGTVRAFSVADGKPLGIVMLTPIWYWGGENTEEFLDLFGGLGVAGDTLIVTTGCRSVYAIQRVQ